MSNRTKNASRNIVWGTANRIITIFLPFLLRTIMIHMMGIEYVGLGSLFTSILQVLSFAELGVGNAIVFSMYRPIAEDETRKICALLNYYKKTYRIIGTVILSIGLVMMPFLNYLIAKDIPEGINLQILFSAYLLNNVVGYYLFAYKQSVFIASQRMDITSKVALITQIIMSTTQILTLVRFRNYYIYVFVIPVCTVVNNIIIEVLSRKIYPQYKCIGDVDDSEKRIIKLKISGLVLQKLGGIILTAADTLVISSVLGLTILGVYNGYYIIITALFSFLAVIQQSIIPSIGNSIVTNSVEKNLNDFRKFHFIYMWFVIWWGSCLFILLQPFIEIWQGKENTLGNNMILLFALYFFTYKMSDICWIYREAIGLWREARFIPLTAAIINLSLNIFLVHRIGLSGVLLSTIFSVVVVYFPWGSKVLFQKYFKSNHEYILYLLRSIKYFLFMCVITCITASLSQLISSGGIIGLVYKGLLCIVVPNVLLIILNIRNKDFRAAYHFVSKIIMSKF